MISIRLRESSTLKLIILLKIIAGANQYLCMYIVYVLHRLHVNAEGLFDIKYFFLYFNFNCCAFTHKELLGRQWSQYLSSCNSIKTLDLFTFYWRVPNDNLNGILQLKILCHLKRKILEGYFNLYDENNTERNGYKQHRSIDTQNYKKVPKTEQHKPHHNWGWSHVLCLLTIWNYLVHVTWNKESMYEVYTVYKSIAVIFQIWRTTGVSTYIYSNIISNQIHTSWVNIKFVDHKRLIVE